MSGCMVKSAKEPFYKTIWNVLTSKPVVSAAAMSEASNFTRASMNGDGNAWFDFSSNKPWQQSILPSTIQGIINPETRQEYILGTLLSGGTGAAFGSAYKKGKKGYFRDPKTARNNALLVGKQMPVAVVEGMITGTGMQWNKTLKAEHDYYGNEINRKDYDNSVDVVVPSDSTSDKVFNYGSVLLGLAGLGLGGYALYKSLTGNKAKAKVKLRGKADDPYDDVEVEMPMDQLNISNTMGKRVNTSVRKTIHESNKFNSRKKDKETGKLISYEEYIGKYGEDDKTKENVLQPLEKQSSYIPVQNVSEQDLERARKKYEKDLERMQKKHERDLKYKGIGMGVGSALGGIGGYIFGSQAFNGAYPTSYSPGIVNTLGGVGGLLGGGLLGGYLADKFSEY